MNVCPSPWKSAVRSWPGRVHDIVPIYLDILFALDIAAGIALGYASAIAYAELMHGSNSAALPTAPLRHEMILSSIIAALMLRDAGGSSGGRPYDLAHRLIPLLQRCATIAVVLLVVGMLTRTLDGMARAWLAGWSALFAAWVLASRTILAQRLQRLNDRGELKESVAVIGPPATTRLLSQRLADQAHIVAVVDELLCTEDSAQLRAALDRLLIMAREGMIDTVILALDHGFADMRTLLAHFDSVPVQIAVCRDSGTLAITPAQSLRMLGGVPLSVMSDRPLKRWDLVMKSALDVIGAALILTIASPLMLAAALAITLEGSGPVIFRQTRSGWSGGEFTLFKFRTMRQCDGNTNPQQTRRNDPRCTKVGLFLRRTSLDELPQLLNVLRGDMSLVGPRPHAQCLHDDAATGWSIVAEYAQRHRVKPGLTGWAQVNGLRGAIRTPEQMRKRIDHDLYYIHHWSIWLDLKILARTPLAVALAENAF